MFGITDYWAFITAGILLNLTPGADTMYILSRSIAQGKKAGIYSALGIGTGSIVHTIMASLGLSVILAESALAFDIVKYLGAAYLIYLGVRSIIAKPSELKVNETVKQKSNKSLYLSGVLTNILNPKVALFFLAFLPQFIDPFAIQNQYPASLPFFILGLTFTFNGTLYCIALALFSAKFSGFLRTKKNFKLWLDKITGSIFILLGIKLALTKK